MSDLHFSFGDQIGPLIIQRAREVLFYDHDAMKAVSIIKTAIGTDKEQSINLLKGTYVLVLVDPKGVLEYRPYDPEIHTDYKPLDVDRLIKSHLDEAERIIDSLKRHLSVTADTIAELAELKRVMDNLKWVYNELK